MTMIVGFLKGGGGAALSPPPMPVEPVVTLASLDTTVAEGGSLAGALGIDPPFGATTTVTLTIAGQGADPAEVPADIQATLAVNVPGGVASHGFTIPVVDDAVEEGAEGGRVTVQAGAGYSVGSPASRDFEIQASDAPVGAGPVEVVSATVLADGITLRVRHTLGSSAWTDFPNYGRPFGGAGSLATWHTQSDAAKSAAMANWVLGNALVAVTVTGDGHNRSGGQAVASASKARTFPAHQVRPAPFPQWPDAPQFEDSDPHDGWPHYFPYTKRPVAQALVSGSTYDLDFLLHEPVQPGATVSVSFGAGWRTGGTAGTIAATNNSATAIQLPGFRWLMPPFMGVRDTTSVTVDCFAWHGLPEGTHGVAGVRICATDGTNKVFGWLSIGTSAQFGDALRCWTGTLDLTGLTAGGVVLIASVYPFVGPVRHCHPLGTDPATETAANLHPGANWRANLRRGEAAIPMGIGYDPTGARYSYTTTGAVTHKYVCVVVNPSGTAASPATRAAAEALCGFDATREAARTAALALPLSSQCPNNEIALETLARLGRTLTAANGLPTPAANNIDDMEIWFVDGAHTLSTGTLSPSRINEECHTWMRGSAATAVTITSGASGTNRVAEMNRWRDVNLRIRPLPIGQINLLDRCRFGRAAGSSGTNASHFFDGASANSHATWIANSEQVADGFVADEVLGNQNCIIAMARSLIYTRQLNCNVQAGCTKSGANTTSNGPVGQQGITASWANETFDDYLVLSGRVFARDGSASAISFFKRTEGSTTSVNRMGIINCLFEDSGTTDTQMMGWTEGGPPTIYRGCVFEGNTLVGNRGPSLHNDPATADLTAAATVTAEVVQCRWANNILATTTSKGDTFNDSTVSGLRSALPGPTPKGQRAQLLDPFIQIKFGCMTENNVILDHCPPSGSRFRRENNGVGALFNPVPNEANTFPVPATSRDWPKFVAPASRLDASTAGNGNYRPQVDSPVRGVARRAQLDADATGTVRPPAPFAAGALEYVA